jgi:hypothetical protein
MIELLDGLKTATLSLMQLRGMAYELVNGDTSKRTLTDKEVIERICQENNIGTSQGMRIEDLAEVICVSFNLEFDLEKDLDRRSNTAGKLSEFFWRKIVAFLKAEPWVFVCNYAENAASAVHNDIFGITYGFHENVTTWRGLVASGPGSFIVFYNTGSAPHSKMTYSSFARIEKIEESRELDEKGRRQWKAKLSDFHMLAPVPESKVEIAGRNSQHGIQAITFDTFRRIVDLGEGVEYLNNAEAGDFEVRSETETSFDLKDVFTRGPSLDDVVPDVGVLIPHVLDESMSDRDFSADRAVSGSRKNSKKLDKQTETQAVKIALAYLDSQGWKLLHDNQLDGVGYDFEFVKDRQSLLIEVKGIRGSRLEFSMTAREFFVCRKKSNFMLIAVTNTLKENEYKIHVLRSSDISKMRRRVIQYRLSPLSEID